MTEIYLDNVVYVFNDDSRLHSLLERNSDTHYVDRDRDGYDNIELHNNSEDNIDQLKKKCEELTQKLSESRKSAYKMANKALKIARDAEAERDKQVIKLLYKVMKLRIENIREDN